MSAGYEIGDINYFNLIQYEMVGAGLKRAPIIINTFDLFLRRLFQHLDIGSGDDGPFAAFDFNFEHSGVRFRF